MQGRIHGLDGMRGVAAFLVLGFHVLAVFGEGQLFDRAWLAVDFFFMLSGYVMARTYEAAMRTGKTGPLAFLTARYRRLWAPVAVGTAIGIGFFVLSDRPLTGAAIIAGLVIVPLPGARMFDLNRPAWSIFFELVANALHAAILYRLSPRVLVTIAFSCAFILATSRLGAGDIFVGHRPSAFLYGVPRVLMAYCIGIALHRVDWRIPSAPGLAMGLLAISLLAIPHGLGWDLIFVLLLSPTLIVMGRSSGGGRRISAVLGGLSFPLYAVHYPVLQLAHHAGLGPISAVAAAIFASIATGLLIDRRLRFALAATRHGDQRAYSTSSISS